MEPFPPRLHVLFARASDDALVIRRGPTNVVAFVHWNRRRDKFTLGQWVRHRVYERRCDLSPKGEYLIYFAMNGHWDSQAGGAWTAISKVPYAKALVVLAKGDCWHGGGLWTGNRTYWLNDGHGHRLVRDDSRVHRDTTFCPPASFGGECPHVYYNRLIRDGWTLVAESLPDVFEKKLPGGWTLRKLAHAGAPAPGHGVYWDEHELCGPDGHVAVHQDWEWADLDGRRLVWASGGRLFAAPLHRKRLGEPTQLYDFAGMEFENLQAPY